MLWLAVGCRLNHPSPYPIGIYSTGGPTNFTKLREAGFNVITGGATGDFLDAAQAAGLVVLASPGTSAGPGFSPSRAHAAVRTFGRHPALWAWYLSDEPELHGVTPDEVRQVHRAIRFAGSRLPTAVTTWSGEALSRYRVADILLVDRYPVGMDPLAMFFKQVRAGRIVADVANRRFIPVIQAMNWNAYPPEIWHLGGWDGGAAPDSRAPSLAELRCMIWGARVLGAEGLFFYCYDDGAWRMAEHPEVWSDLGKAVREVRDCEPLFRARQPRVRLGLQWFEPGRQYNEALESSVLVTLLEVETGSAAVPAGRYLVLVNTTAEHHLVRLNRPDWYGVEVPVLGGQSTVHFGDGHWLDPLPPYGVQILGPLPAALPLEPPAE